MRTYEFITKSKSAVRLGCIATPVCYMKIGDRFTPAVLCLDVASGDASKTEDNKAEVIIRGVPELLYWGGEEEPVVRKKIPFALQKQLGLPMKMMVPVEEAPVDWEQKKEYYLIAEKVCCGLDADCMTEAMKEQYQQHVQEKPAEPLFSLYRYFFSEACEKIF